MSVYWHIVSRIKVFTKIVLNKGKMPLVRYTRDMYLKYINVSLPCNAEAMWLAPLSPNLFHLTLCM